MIVQVIVGLLYLGLMFSGRLEALPHPKDHYRWEALPTGEIVMYFMKDGYKSRYVYRMVAGAIPAVACQHRYEEETFKLITFSSSVPYWYEVYYKPTRRWDSRTERYIKLED